MIDWLKGNAEWICAIIMAICAVLGVIYHVFNKDNNNQTIGDVTNSNVNQAGEDIKNVEQGRKKARGRKY